MQFTTLALSAFAATAFAQLPSGIDPSQIAPILSVLQTALPSSVIAEAIANPTAFSSEIASSFSAGQTPGWFSALPNSIQTFLVPVASASSSLSSALTSSSSSLSSAMPTGIFSNSSSASSSSSSASSSSSSSSTTIITGGTTPGAVTTSTTPGAAAAQTAAYGMGIAGALGVVGLLAL